MNKELEKAIKNMQKFVRCKQNMTTIKTRIEFGQELLKGK